MLDQNITVTLGKKTVGTFPVVNALPTDVYDEHGTASVTFTVPTSVKGDVPLTITGDTTGTAVTLDVTVAKKVTPGHGDHGHGHGHGHAHGLTPGFPGWGWWASWNGPWTEGYDGADHSLR